MHRCHGLDCYVFENSFIIKGSQNTITILSRPIHAFLQLVVPAPAYNVFVWEMFWGTQHVLELFQKISRLKESKSSSGTLVVRRHTSSITTNRKHV